jgi:hypothetical protein
MIKHDFIEELLKKGFIEKFNLVELSDYVLPITYNKYNKSILINLKYFGAEEISQVDPKTLFACIIYGEILHKLLSKKVEVKNNYAGIFINYYLSMFIRLFGKQFGLLGTYTSEIPKLKFLIAVYILESFFGITGDSNYRKAATVGQIDYRPLKSKLDKYDFYDIGDFVKSLSDLKVMVGINKYRFSEKILKFFTINFIPALEDCSRFVSSIGASNVSGSKLIPGFIYSYNENEYNKIVDLSNYILKK